MLKVLKTVNILNYEKGPIRRSLFSNGAVSLFHQFKGMKSASVNLYFLAGSYFEHEADYGISHVIEHMLFKEEDNDSVVKTLERLGAQVNAYTYKEYVCFELECLASRLDQFLPMFLSLFFNPVFKTKFLEIEKKIIIQELKEDKDDHEVEGLEIIFNKNFDAKFGHAVGGSLKNVKQTSIQSMFKFYHKFFTADRMVLSIVSGKQHKLIEKTLLDTMPARMNIKAKPFRLGHNSIKGKMKHFNSHLVRKTENNIVYYSMDGLSLEHTHYYDLMILDELLFEGMTSKFFLLLREELGLIYGLGSAINSFYNTGNYVMIFNTQKQNISVLDKNIRNVIDFYSANEFSVEEVQATKNRVLDSFEMSSDSMGERCEFIAMEELFNTKQYSLASMKTKLDKVTPKSIRMLLNKLLKRKMSRLILGPK